MVKEGYEAKIAAAAREADRSARREERRKYREKSIASRLNDTLESMGGSSNAEPEVMVDRAVTRALAGDVEGAKVMLERSTTSDACASKAMTCRGIGSERWSC